MDEIREKLRSAISLWVLNSSEFPSDLVDEILDIPEIKEALALRNFKFVSNGALGHSIRVRNPD